jgi:hypothetical protein
MLYLHYGCTRPQVKTTTGFSPFQLIHGVEEVMLIECEIPSLNIVVELLLT